MAATHGVYKSVNTKNTIALCVLNIVATGLPPKSTVIVLTTLSFAVNPVIRAVDALQSPNPSGANIGAITPPINARILSLESDTILNVMLNV